VLLSVEYHLDIPPFWVKLWGDIIIRLGSCFRRNSDAGSIRKMSDNLTLEPLRFFFFFFFFFLKPMAWRMTAHGDNGLFFFFPVIVAA
jgi:hypothetical protein